MNILTKKTSYNLYQPNPYYAYIPGYSYQILSATDSYELTSSGLQYVISYLQARGFNATSANVKLVNFTFVGNTLYVDLYLIPKLIGSTYYWTNPSSIPLRIGDYKVLSNTSYVNVPASKTLVYPNPYYKEVNNIGWNGFAISKDSFFKEGYGTFSVSPQVSGVVVGIIDKTKSTTFTYQQIDYFIYFHLGVYSCFINNINVTTDSTYIESDVFKIEITNTKVIYYKNNVEIYSATIAENNNTFVLASCLYSSTDSVINSNIVQSNLNNFTTTVYIKYNIKSVPINYIGLSLKIPVSIHSSFTGSILYFNTKVNIKYLLKVIPDTYIGAVIPFKPQITFDIDGLVPTLPLQTIVEIPYKVYIRDNYVYPPKMFVIT